MVISPPFYCFYQYYFIIITSCMITVSRCNCNGNAASCDMSVALYTCNCNTSTYSTGDRCERCEENRFRPTAQFDCQGMCDCHDAGVINTSQKCLQVGWFWFFDCFLLLLPFLLLLSPLLLLFLHLTLRQQYWLTDVKHQQLTSSSLSSSFLILFFFL